VYRFIDCYAECHYAECRHADCRGASFCTTIKGVSIK
jgi:hypothetical protein